MVNRVSIKELVFAFATIITGLANGYFWREFIYSENYADIALLSLPVASMFVFAVFFALLSLFSKNSHIIFTTAALSFSGGLFLIDGHKTVIIGSAVGMAGAVFAAYKIQNDVKDSFTFKFS